MQRPADGGVELDLDADQLPAVGGVPGEEPAEHVLRRLPLPLVGPARTRGRAGRARRPAPRARPPAGSPSATCWATACTAVPTVRVVSGEASAPTALSTHFSGHRWKVSIAEGRTRTGMLVGHQRGVVRQRRQPPPARRARHRARPRRPAGGAPTAAADRRSGGVCGSVSARRRSATSAGRVSERGSSVSGRPSSGGGATRSRNRDAVAPASAPSRAPSTAVTSSRRRARVQAT